MDYVLVNDNCDDCRYVSDAFSLLRLPLRKLSLDDFHANAVTTNTVAVIVCRQVETPHSKQISDVINLHALSVISLNEPSKKSPYNKDSVHYLKMPFSKYELRDALTHCYNHKNNLPDLFDIRYPIFEKLIGQSKEITKIKSMIKQVAYSDTTVLILGQSGSGKDVIASCIHYLSNRREHPFVPINCGAIPSELIESELFGHEKGSFTGASARRAGRFEMANRGTLFLDEIGDMPLPMQVKLLRVIQERKIERVGGTASVDVDVRLIAATNQNLEEQIAQHQFREDLFYRLNVFPIHVPSLSERREDIPQLIGYHLDKIYERLKHSVMFTDRAKEVLCDYSWPGNVRELQNFLERMVILYPDRVVDEKDIDIAYKQRKLPIAQATSHLLSDTQFNIKEYLSKIEHQLIDAALKRSNGAITLAAEYLSMSRNTLLEKIKKYNLMTLLQK